MSKRLGKKAFLFFSLLFLISTAFIITSILPTKDLSRAHLSIEKSKFILNFDIQEKDQENFSAFLQNLSLPNNTQDGVKFELDATSSASLAFSLPIEAKLEVNPSKLYFSGFHYSPKILMNTPSDILLPERTFLIIFANDLTSIFEKTYNLPNNLISEIKKVMKPPHYLYAFSSQDIVLAANSSQSISTQELQSFYIDDPSSYKKDQYNGIELNLLKNMRENKEETTIVLFKINDWTYLTTSQKAAEEIINLHTNESNSKSQPFPKEPYIFAVSFNKSEHVSEDFYDKLIYMHDSPPSNIKKIKYFRFLLKANTFSGLIELK